MILDIVQAGDPILRHTSSEVDLDLLQSSFVQELISSMTETMRKAHAVGLAAPQVGESLRIFVMEDREECLDKVSAARRTELARDVFPLTALINPILEPVKSGDKVDFFEGCLSISGFSAVVPRSTRVRLRGVDRDGEPVDRKLSGWPARIAQHEMDHLNGKLYIDSMNPRTFTTASNLGRHFKARPIAAVRELLADE